MGGVRSAFSGAWVCEVDLAVGGYYACGARGFCM